MPAYERKDFLYRKAKSEGYRSRAAYKLIELDKKRRLFFKGARVVDLGCFPGGWLQVASEKVGPKGRVAGIDLKPVEPLSAADGAKQGSDILILLGDAADSQRQDELQSFIGGRADVLLSDMSPELTGIRFRDAARSAELVELALYCAGRLLKHGGSFAAKIFPGPESDELFKMHRPRFEKLSRVTLDASRSSSKEFYIVGTGFTEAEKAS